MSGGMDALGPLAIQSAHRVLGLSYGDIAHAVGTDEETLSRWLQGERPATAHQHRLHCLNALVREIQKTMRPETVRDWLHRPLPAFDGATAYELILSGRCEGLLSMLGSLNMGLFL